MSRTNMLAILIIVQILLLGGYSFWPAIPYNAREYQCLVDKTRAGGEKQLNSRTVVHGLQEDERDATEFVSYPGMRIHYSADGTVLRVESNNL